MMMISRHASSSLFLGVAVLLVHGMLPTASGLDNGVRLLSTEVCPHCIYAGINIWKKELVDGSVAVAVVRRHFVPYGIHLIWNLHVKLDQLLRVRWFPNLILVELCRSIILTIIQAARLSCTCK